MVRLAEFVLSATVLLWRPTAIVVAKEDNDDKPLFFQPLDYFAPCADGSPGGIYTDFYGLNDEGTVGETRNSHIIHFNGGGGCASETSCRILSKQKPYYFSSSYELESITGHTIVSNDPFENPGLADDFVKWVVPYCTQDLWLGSGKEAFGFLRSGSLLVDATLRHWLDAVTASNITNRTIDTLVFSGHSAGTFAILNHMDQIRNIASEAGVKRLRVVLDASMLTDLLDADFETLFASTVDPEVHPLCLEDPEKTPYDELLNRGELSQLPCCLSTHCMLRHSPSLSEIKSETSSKDERILLIDTVYDYLQTFSYLMAEGGNRNAAGMMSITGLSSSIFNIGESGGKRKARILETLFAGGRYVGPNVVWAMPSSTLHNTLLPSAELAIRHCDRKVAEEDSACESGDSDCVFLANPFGIQDVCNATGIGLSAEVFGGLKITSWTNTEAWKRATINGKSVRDIISDFVLTAGPANGSNSSARAHATVLFDTCPGPNCVPEGQISGNPVQSLLEIEDMFVSVPVWLMALISVVLFAIVVAFLVMAYHQKNNKSDVEQSPSLTAADKKSKRLLRVATTRSFKSAIHIQGLCVKSNEGSEILEDVDLSLQHSTLNCLLGKSGSGKSTLLSVLCCQLKPNLQVTMKAASDIGSIPSTFMRQQDLVTMENITPIDYLHSTSEIYGADSETLEFVLGLIQPFFPVKTMRDENNATVVLLDPFHDAAIKDLSGGQRRMLAIAAALFQNTSLLLLDEPLSGLDSVSSMKVIELLGFIAEENAVTIMMTLHQPSTEILEAMDSIMVLAKGKVLFDSRIDSIKDKRRSSADFIHELLSEAQPTKALICNIEEEDEDRASLMSATSSIVLTKRTSIQSSKHLGKTETIAPSSRKLQRMKSVKKKPDSYMNKLRLWQVQPLVRRISLEHGLRLPDLLVVILCYLVVAGWGSLDSQNPLLSFLVIITYISAAGMIQQVRVVVHWDILSAHLWDLEDTRISPLAFLIASGLQIFYAPIVSIPLALALGYAVLGWNWESFWPSSLFVTLTTIVLLQLGKTIAAKANNYRFVAALLNLLILIGFVLSGLFVPPSKVPVVARWIMYLSPFFWGTAGAILSMFQYADALGEQPCQSFAACIVYHPSFMAYVTGFPALVTARTSMYVLVGMALILILIEYILLCQKIVQRTDYATLTDDKKDSIEEVTEMQDNDEIIEFHYESTRDKSTYVVERRRSSMLSFEPDILDKNEEIIQFHHESTRDENLQEPSASLSLIEFHNKSTRNENLSKSTVSFLE